MSGCTCHGPRRRLVRATEMLEPVIWRVNLAQVSSPPEDPRACEVLISASAALSAAVGAAVIATVAGARSFSGGGGGWRLQGGWHRCCTQKQRSSYQKDSLLNATICTTGSVETLRQPNGKVCEAQRFMYKPSRKCWHKAQSSDEEDEQDAAQVDTYTADQGYRCMQRTTKRAAHTHVSRLRGAVTIASVCCH